MRKLVTTRTVGIGKDGIGLSWQQSFPENTKCHKCKKNARLAFVVFEGFPKPKSDEKKPYVCRLWHNGKDKKFWPHDAIAVAIYFCEDVKCARATALWNQA